MIDRLRFWSYALIKGAGQLNTASGWLSLIILVLGVAVGITVPLVFKLSSWLTAVVLLALLILVFLEGTYRVWHAANLQRDDALREIDRRFSAIRHSLQIIEVPSNLIYHSSSMDVQIGLKLKNNSDEYIRYEVQSVSTVIGNIRSPDGPVLATSAIIPPHGTDTFMPPPATGAPLTWEMGSLSFVVRYGDASGQPRYQARWEYAVKAMRNSNFLTSRIVDLNLALLKPQEVEDI